MAIPVRVINGKKTFTVLENNPEVFTALAHKLGLPSNLGFHDIYSLSDPTLLSFIPRPVLALIVIIPLTPTWNACRQAEDKDLPSYAGKGAEEPVIWFTQTIGHACGSIALVHSVLNGPAKEHIIPGSTFAKLREEAIPLGMAARADVLYNSQELETAHQSVAEMGDTVAPSAEEGDRLGQHFVAFVKEGGRLWELEGGRKGPLDRGPLGEEEDVLSKRAIELGLGRIMEEERLAAERNDGAGGDLRFSCIALAAKTDGEEGG